MASLGGLITQKTTHCNVCPYSVWEDNPQALLIKKLVRQIKDETVWPEGTFFEIICTFRISHIARTYTFRYFIDSTEATLCCSNGLSIEFA